MLMQMLTPTSMQMQTLIPMLIKNADASADANIDADTEADNEGDDNATRLRKADQCHDFASQRHL